jgi:hypothetical protein
LAGSRRTEASVEKVTSLESNAGDCSMKQEFTQILNEFIYANPEKQEEIVKSMEAKAAETRAAAKVDGTGLPDDDGCRAH